MNRKAVTVASLLANVVLIALLLTRTGCGGGSTEDGRGRQRESLRRGDAGGVAGRYRNSGPSRIARSCVPRRSAFTSSYRSGLSTVRFGLRYQVLLVERSRSDGKIVGFVDAAGDNVLVAMDDDAPHTLQIDSGRKYIDPSGIYGPWNREAAAEFQVQTGTWYDVVCTVDGSKFTVTAGEVRLSHPFAPAFPVSIWLEVQRTGAKYRNLTVEKL